MKVNWKKLKLTKEERAIENALERNEFVRAPADHFQEIARAIARRRKEATLSLRINRDDLKALKQKAKDLGVPYQTLITEILHRFAA